VRDGMGLIGCAVDIMTATKSPRNAHHHPPRGFSRLEAVAVVGIVGLLIALLLPAVQMARDAARRSQSRNNLRNLGLAFHNYHSGAECLPPGGYLLADGRDGHGWFALLTPFLDASNLYSQIDFDRPWTDSLNRHLFRTPYSTALIPGVDHIATAEGYALLHYPGNPSVLHLNSSLALSDFRGGTSHTWLLGEAVGNHQPWGSPFNWRAWDLPLNSDDDAFGGPAGATNFLLADGSVRLISDDADASVRGSLDGGLPTPDPANLRQPPRHWEYVSQVSPAARPEVIALDDLEWDGLVLVIDRDDRGNPLAAVVRPLGKGSDRDPDLSDLRQIVEHCPEIRFLKIWISIDEPASPLVAQLPQLETLAVPFVAVTPAVLNDLRSLEHLQEVRIETLPADDLRTLTESLPDVTVHVRRTSDVEPRDP
jgi:type II secretory pathway pseudopilin PulG